MTKFSYNVYIWLIISKVLEDCIKHLYFVFYKGLDSNEIRLLTISLDLIGLIKYMKYDWLD